MLGVNPHELGSSPSLPVPFLPPQMSWGSLQPLHPCAPCTPSCSLTAPHQHREGAGHAKQGKLSHLFSMLLFTVLLLVEKEQHSLCAQSHPCSEGFLPSSAKGKREPSSLSILNCYSKMGNKGQQANREQTKGKLLLPRLQGSRLAWLILLQDQTRDMNPPPRGHPCFALGANAPPRDAGNHSQPHRTLLTSLACPPLREMG